MNSRDEKIMKLYGDGMLIKRIAVEVGMAANSVGQVLKRLGVERPSKPQKKNNPVDDAKVVALWDDGLSVSAISERVGAGPAVVRSVLNAAGKDIKGARRVRYDGRAGNARMSGNAFARMAWRT